MRASANPSFGVRSAVWYPALMISSRPLIEGGVFEVWVDGTPLVEVAIEAVTGSQCTLAVDGRRLVAGGTGMDAVHAAGGGGGTMAVGRVTTVEGAHGCCAGVARTDVCNNGVAVMGVCSAGVGLTDCGAEGGTMAFWGGCVGSEDGPAAQLTGLGAAR